MNAAFNLEAWVTARRSEVNALLEARLAPPSAGDDPGRLAEAMRYSLLAPGKRLRPLLALGAAEALGSSLPDPVRVAAAAVELVHCYSLIHDDLPCMDDDDYRRGKPTSHKVFGDAAAVLAGDALLTLAFEWLAEAGLAADTRAGQMGAEAGLGTGADFTHATLALARGAGMWGMVRGQSRDLGEPAPDTVAALERLHQEKTGALFRAALAIGGRAAGATARQLDALEAFADAYGVAFQHADDLSDHDHPDFAAAAHERVAFLAQQATSALEMFGGGAAPLRGLAVSLVELARSNAAGAVL